MAPSAAYIPLPLPIVLGSAGVVTRWLLDRWRLVRALRPEAQRAAPAANQVAWIDAQRRMLSIDPSATASDFNQARESSLVVQAPSYAAIQNKQRMAIECYSVVGYET